MDSTISLGKKLLYFRERAHMSQLNLEVQIDASEGMISRIENDKVNPTKETLSKLTNTLHLRPRETSYLYGVFQKPASEEEVAEVQSYYKKNYQHTSSLSYILDERYRLIAVSDAFVKLIGVDPEIVSTCLLKPMIPLLLDDKLNLGKFFSESDFLEMMSNILFRYYHEVGFMVDDPYYIQTIKAINKDKNIHRIWANLVKSNGEIPDYQDTRKVDFTFAKLKIPMVYSIEPLHFNNRFEMMEYLPTNKLLKFVTRLL